MHKSKGYKCKKHINEVFSIYFHGVHIRKISYDSFSCVDMMHQNIFKKHREIVYFLFYFISPYRDVLNEFAFYSLRMLEHNYTISHQSILALSL